MLWYWLTRRLMGRVTVLLLGREGRGLLASSVHSVGPCAVMAALFSSLTNARAASRLRRPPSLS